MVSTGQYQHKKFSTSLTKTIDVKSADDLMKESEKLFEQAKKLTERDIKKILG